MHLIDGYSMTPEERLALSRAELRRIFEPIDRSQSSAANAAGRGDFPRSAIFKLLSRGGKASAMGIAGIALLAARPAMAAKLVKFLPMGAIAKILVARFIDRQQHRATP